MPEYILKSDALALDPEPKHLRQYQTMNLDDAYEDGWYGAQAAISQLPPADVKLVARGEWIEDPYDRWRCSECGYGNQYAYSWELGEDVLQDYFCPHCGADMRGEKNA